jgi:hypothetical protein
LEEPLANHNECGAHLVIAQILKSREASPTIDRSFNHKTSIGVQEKPSDQSNGVPRLPNFLAEQRQSDVSRDGDELTGRSSLEVRRRRLTEKQAIAHALEHAEENLDQIDKMHKGSPVYNSLIGVSLPRAQPEEPHHLKHKKTRFETGVDEPTPRAPRTFSLDPKRPRRVSAAPGIDALPLGMVQRGLKPTNNRKRHRIKEQHYPPEEQHPPAPAYPSRETPSWTRPDTNTSPINPKAELREGKNADALVGDLDRKASVATCQFRGFRHQ